MTDYTDCLEANGIDTRQLDQPTLPIPFDCMAVGLNLALADAGSYECIHSTLEQFSPGVNPRVALDRCAIARGVRYSHGGRPGLLLLSKSPIENLELIPYNTFLIHRAVIYATIENTRYAFTQFPKNYLDDIDVLLGPFQYGALQPQLAQDVIGRDPDVIVGASELRRRRGRTFLTALGLGLGVGLVVTVAALSDGLDRAQDKVLKPLTGVGTDLSVTRPLDLGNGERRRAAAGGPGSFGNLSDAERRRLRVRTGPCGSGSTTLGKPGEKFTRTTSPPGPSSRSRSRARGKVAGSGRRAERGIRANAQRDQGVGHGSGAVRATAASVAGPGRHVGPGGPGGPPSDVDFDAISVSGVDQSHDGARRRDRRARSPRAPTSRAGTRARPSSAGATPAARTSRWAARSSSVIGRSTWSGSPPPHSAARPPTST